MKTLLVTSVLLTAALVSSELAQAKSAWSPISMATYKSRCLAAGGTVTNVSAGGVRCRLPSGATVTCYDTDGPGISCDYRTASGRPKLFELTPGVMLGN